MASFDSTANQTQPMIPLASKLNSFPVEDSQQERKNFITIRPRFRVTDWNAMLPLMQQTHDETLAGPSLLHDWTRGADDQLTMRTTFDDADDLLINLESFFPIIDAMLSSAAILDRFEIHGPEAELAKIKKEHENLDAEFYDSGTGFQTGYFSQTNNDVAKADLSRMVCTCNPQFTIKDWSEVEPIMEQFMEVTASEPNCLYFGWTKSGDKLCWHADFANGEALKLHFEQVRPLINNLTVVDGPAKLDRMEIHGPSDELEKVDESSTGYIEGLPLEYFVTDNRVKRISQNFENRV